MLQGSGFLRHSVYYFVLPQCTCLTDGRTNGQSQQTDVDSKTVRIRCVCIQSRAVRADSRPHAQTRAPPVQLNCYMPPRLIALVYCC